MVELGIIAVNEAGFAKWGSLDLDIKGISKPGLIADLHDIGITNAVVLRSKSDGAHATFFFKEPVLATALRRKLAEIADALGYGGCEIFPKQDKIDPEAETDGDRIGNWLNMPYFNADQFNADDPSYSQRRVAYADDGRELPLAEFEAYATRQRMIFEDLKVTLPITPSRKASRRSGPAFPRKVFQKAAGATMAATGDSINTAVRFAA